jgi:hypothetical protein
MQDLNLHTQMKNPISVRPNFFLIQRPPLPIRKLHPLILHCYSRPCIYDFIIGDKILRAPGEKFHAAFTFTTILILI